MLRRFLEYWFCVVFRYLKVLRCGFKVLLGVAWCCCGKDNWVLTVLYVLYCISSVGSVETTPQGQGS